MKGVKVVADKGFLFSVIGIAATFPFSYKISNPWIVLMVLFWLGSIFVGENRWRFNQMNKWEKWSLSSFILFFLWHLLSLSYSEDLSSGIKAIESKLSLLVFPLVLFNANSLVKRLWLILRVFYVSIAVSIIYLLINSALHYFTEGSWLTYHDFTAPFNAHAVFFSYFLFLSILIVVYELNNSELSRTHKLLLIILLVISFVGLLFCASKNVSIVTIFFSLMILARRFFQKGLRLKEVLIFLIASVIILISALQMDAVKNRMAELSSGSGMENFEIIRSGGEIGVNDNLKYNGTSLRITLWYLGMDELIERDRLLIGLSPADRRGIMNQRYNEVGMGPYRDYNLHNQFIQTVVELGIVGLLLYLIIYLSLFGLAIKQGNYLLLVFLTATVIFQLTESILERNKVIVFVMFFLCLLPALKNTIENEDRHTGN
ncbi:MAG: hypothetical protein CMP59_03675 [Flavobacteriales bacterium]|nr:hypothetical protein [Flavobacteriales bacterium]|tara:strand:+ start:441 stop:1733 length:1293 start_codon:yes stop_codon:yes gene_type:complete